MGQPRERFPEASEFPGRGDMGTGSIFAGNASPGNIGKYRYNYAWIQNLMRKYMDKEFAGPRIIPFTAFFLLPILL